jgi:hypothetical protein
VATGRNGPLLASLQQIGLTPLAGDEQRLQLPADGDITVPDTIRIDLP